MNIAYIFARIQKPLEQSSKWHKASGQIDRCFQNKILVSWMILRNQKYV